MSDDVSEMVRLEKWRARLTKARERGCFTEKDVQDASNWISCAVGEGKKLLTAYVIPLNNDLWYCGIDFSIAVEIDNFDRAEFVIETIELVLEVMKRESSARGRAR